MSGTVFKLLSTVESLSQSVKRGLIENTFPYNRYEQDVCNLRDNWGKYSAV